MDTAHGQYELIDTESANLVGHYDTEEAALRDVAETIRAYGREAPEVLALALMRLDAPPGKGNIAAGAELAMRALARYAPADHARA